MTIPTKAAAPGNGAAAAPGAAAPVTYTAEAVAAMIEAAATKAAEAATKAALAAAPKAAPRAGGGRLNATAEQLARVIEVVAPNGYKTGASRLRLALYRTGATVGEHYATVERELGAAEARKVLGDRGDVFGWDQNPHERQGAPNGYIKAWPADSERGRALRAAYLKAKEAGGAA